MNNIKIKEKLLEIQDMLKEIPQECKGSSQEASQARHNYMKIKRSISDIIELL